MSHPSYVVGCEERSARAEMSGQEGAWRGARRDLAGDAGDFVDYAYASSFGHLLVCTVFPCSISALDQKQKPGDNC